MTQSLLFTIASDALPPSTHVVSVVGHEAISHPYGFQIGLEINDDSFNPEGALRARAKLNVNQASSSEPYFFHGIIAAIELLHHYAGKTLYRATLVPKLWHLGQTLHSRIFTDNTIIEIIQAVLKDGGLEDTDVQFQLLQRYPKLEHVCQYKESDLDFVSRWMEREGLYYFFEQEEEGEKLCITDSISFHGRLSSGSVRYVPLSGNDSMALEALDSFRAKHSALPARVELADYDYLRPTLQLRGRGAVDQQGQGEIRLFGENPSSTADATRYARVRAEALLMGQRVFHGRGRVFHLRPNYRFTLEDHPNPTYNSKIYLTTELEHLGNQSATDPHVKRLLDIEELGADEYVVELAAVPAESQVRAARAHPWPRVDGYEVGRVCGEAASDYAQLDEHGRYKCRVLFDESDLVDGSATTWIRMMQPHGGGVEGFHFPLRKGTEIVVFFLAGDPDRPVIAGVVPNPLKPSPVTSANHTKNVVQTGGRNRLELEDLDGSQWVKLSTPYSDTFIHMGLPDAGHELVMKTDDNALLDAGLTLQIHSGSWREDWVKGGYFNTTVDGTVTDAFHGTHTTTTEGKVTEIYQAGQETTVDAAVCKATYNAGQDTTVHGGLTLEHYNVGHETHVKGGHKLFVAGDQTIDVQTNKTETVAGNCELTINGSTKVELKGPEEKKTWGPFKQVKLAEDINVTYGYSSDTFLGAKNENTIGALVETYVAVKVEAGLAASFKFVAGVKAEFDGTIDLRAKPLEVNNAAVGHVYNMGAFFQLATPTMVLTGGFFMSRAALQMIN
jgi:type VI secretion system secreted protein VgrG